MELPFKTNLHFGQHGVSCRVGEEELEAVCSHLHVGRQDEQHGSLVHVPLGETTSDVGAWRDERTESQCRPAQAATRHTLTDRRRTCGSVLQVAKVWRSADGELQLLRGAVGVGGLQVFGGDEDAEASGPQIHHRAGTAPAGQTGRGPVHSIHLNTAGDFYYKTAEQRSCGMYRLYYHVLFMTL